VVALLTHAAYATGRGARSEHVVIRLPKSALVKYGGDELDVLALRKQATVTRYGLGEGTKARRGGGGR
jgi:hypothetical protein